MRSSRRSSERELTCVHEGLPLTPGISCRYTDEAVKKSGMLGMGGSTKHSYSADVIAMQVAVEKGFAGEA